MTLRRSTASVLATLRSTAGTLRGLAGDLRICTEELARAGALAIAAADWDSLARVTLELLSTTVSALPLDIATGWRASLPGERRVDPAFALLDAAITAAEDFTDTSVDTQVGRDRGRLGDRGYADREMEGSGGEVLRRCSGSGPKSKV